MNRKDNPDHLLLISIVAYSAASIGHYVHNAEFLENYPNMPDWITRFDVYLALAGVLFFGIVGIFLVRCGRRVFGLVVLGIYAALGLDGLAHYSLAPMSAHTAAMNITIWLEVIAALVLLTFVGARLCPAVKTRTQF